MSNYLSKSRVLSFRQCPKRLWLEVHRGGREVFGADAELAFIQGNEVGEQARRHFGGGTLVASQDNLSGALAETTAALKVKPAIPIYEATFAHAGLLVRVDALVPDGARRRLVEVKSAASVKAYHVEDIAIQRWVLERLGVQTSASTLMHVDSDFVYQGNGDYQGLLVEEDRTGEAAALDSAVSDWVAVARRTLEGAEPEVAMGEQCSSPFACPFQSYCERQEGTPEYPVTLLPNRQGKIVSRQLIAAGLHDLRDVPEERLAEYPDLARIQRATATGEPYLDPQAGDELARLPYPRAWLDFESIGFVVPRWPGTKPYQQVPFQWSCYIEATPGNYELAEFLDLSGNDPRRHCAQALARVLTGVQCVIAYNASYEKTRLLELAALFPDLAPKLSRAAGITWDLLSLVRRSYYHRDMRGSWSIKAVLPAVLKTDPYADLPGVRSGGAAQLAYYQATQNRATPERKAELADGLRAYCRVDVWAMIAVASALRGQPPPNLD